MTVNRKSPMAAIIGGTLAGVMAFGILAALIFFLRRRRRIQPVKDGEKVDLVFTPFGEGMDAASFNRTLPVSVGHANLTPSHAFPPEIQNDPGGVPILEPNAMMATFPPASDRFIPQTTTVPYFPTATPAPIPPPAQPTPPPPVQATQPIPPSAEQSSPTSWDVPVFNSDRSQHDADVITVPESTAPSISSSTRLMTRNHPMRDDEVFTIASLMNQGCTAAEAMRILEAMRSIDDKGMNTGDDSLNNASSWASTSAAGDDHRSTSHLNSGTARAGPSEPRPLPTPNTPAPAYDFKMHP